MNLDTHAMKVRRAFTEWLLKYFQYDQRDGSLIEDVKLWEAFQFFHRHNNWYAKDVEEHLRHIGWMPDHQTTTPCVPVWDRVAELPLEIREHISRMGWDAASRFRMTRMLPRKEVAKLFADSPEVFVDGYRLPLLDFFLYCACIDCRQKMPEIMTIARSQETWRRCPTKVFREKLQLFCAKLQTAVPTRQATKAFLHARGFTIAQGYAHEISGQMYIKDLLVPGSVPGVLQSTLGDLAQDILLDPNAFLGAYGVGAYIDICAYDARQRAFLAPELMMDPEAIRDAGKARFNLLLQEFVELHGIIPEKVRGGNNARNEAVDEDANEGNASEDGSEGDHAGIQRDRLMDSEMVAGREDTFLDRISTPPGTLDEDSPDSEGEVLSGEEPAVATEPNRDACDRLLTASPMASTRDKRQPSEVVDDPSFDLLSEEEITLQSLRHCFPTSQRVRKSLDNIAKALRVPVSALSREAILSTHDSFFAEAAAARAIGSEDLMEFHASSEFIEKRTNIIEKALAD